MAKKVYTHEFGADGKPRVVEEKGLTRAQRKSLAEMPWTKGPGNSKLKRAARALWG